MIVQDTHALLWWVEGDTGKLSTAVRSEIASERKAGGIIVSSITVWEIALLV